MDWSSEKIPTSRFDATNATLEFARLLISGNGLWDSLAQDQGLAEMLFPRGFHRFEGFWANI